LIVGTSEELPQRLQRGPRVLKQHRGQSGNGVWRVEASGSRLLKRRNC
jgi:aminoglycoside phosphotransferase